MTDSWTKRVLIECFDQWRQWFGDNGHCLNVVWNGWTVKLDFALDFMIRKCIKWFD